MTPASVLQVRDLTKEYRAGGRSLVALSKISFDVHAGEFVSLLGASGSGKSTLLNVIAGLDAPTTGGVWLDGKAVARPGPERGFVFQKDCLFPWLTVRENVEFAGTLACHKTPAAPGGPSAAAPRRRVDALLAAVGLEAFEAHHPRQLSGGMRQRAAIARALLHQPRILLMDEPFGALDAQTREQMQTLLLGLCRAAETTVLFVTHDVEEAAFLSDRVVVLTSHPGSIAADVPIELERARTPELKLEPAFSAARGKLMRALQTARRSAA
jgi:NitT/TauT family transport system ATP-binding protein